VFETRGSSVRYAIAKPLGAAYCGGLDSGLLDGGGGVLDLLLLSGAVLLVPALDSVPPGDVALPVAEPGVIPK